MAKSRSFALLAVVVGALVALPMAPARAQYGQSAELCGDLEGERGVQDDRFVFNSDGSFRVVGEAGCGPAGAQGQVAGQSHRFTFSNSSFVVATDGTYRSPTLRLPAHMAPGVHRIFAVFPDGEVVLPILIVDPDGTDNGGGALATTANRSTGGGGGGGVLPATGSSILMLILWSLALTATGTALVFAARRRGLQFQPLRAIAGRRRTRSSPLALPPPDVPFIDTRGFVPIRRVAPPATPRASVTEADVLPGIETDLDD